MKSLLSKLLISFALLTALFFGYNYHIDKVQSQARTEIAQEYNTKLIALQNKADAATIQLSEKVKVITDEKNSEILATNARYESIISSLRNRPNRPASESNLGSSTEDTESKTGATGVQLYRPDAEFLTRFSRDTQELQSELKACYKQYEEVQNAVNSFSTN